MNAMCRRRRTNYKKRKREMITADVYVMYVCRCRGRELSETYSNMQINVSTSEASVAEATWQGLILVFVEVDWCNSHVEKSL